MRSVWTRGEGTFPCSLPGSLPGLTSYGLERLERLVFMFDDCSLDAVFDELAEIGRLSGHVVCRCPHCGRRQMVAYRSASQPWPRCRLCSGPTPEPWPLKRPAGWVAPPRQMPPRLEPLSDLAGIWRSPGQLPARPKAKKKPPPIVPSEDGTTDGGLIDD